MSPGPIMDMIIEQLKESDLESFREKIKKEEIALAETRLANGLMTRDQMLQNRKEHVKQIDLDYEERLIGPEEDYEKENENTEVTEGEGKEQYQKFMDQLK